MAIQYPNFPRLTGADMGAFDLGAAIKSGLGNYSAYQEAKFKPKNLAEELLSKQLANKINTPYAQNAQRVFDADIGGKEGELGLLDYRKQLLQAQANAAGQPKMTNLEKAQQGYLRAESQFGKDSIQANQAKSYAERLAQGANGTQFNIDPETHAVSFSQGGYGRNSPSNQIVTDKDGNQTSVSKATAPTSSSLQKSSQAEIGRSMIAERADMPYLGTGSNVEIAKDRLAYIAGDKKAGERLVKAAVAEMLVPEYAGLQLAAQGVPATIPALEHQSQVIKQGWPQLASKIVENLPKDLQQEARKNHASILREIKEAKELNAAQGFPIALKKKDENPLSSKSVNAFVNQISKVLVQTNPNATPENILYTAKVRKITPEQVVKELMAKKNKRGA